MRHSRRGQFTAMGYAFTWTLGAAVCLISGLAGYRLSGPGRVLTGSRWSNDCIWSQVWMGLRDGVRRRLVLAQGPARPPLDAYVPELAGRDASGPPSRRIERR